MSAGTDPTADPVHGAEAQRWGGWSWREPMHGEHFRRCSYCGSVHPEDLAAEPAWRANWADRKYGWPHKLYADIPNRDPDALFAVGSVHGGAPDQPLGLGYVPWDDLTESQRQIYVRDHGPFDDRYPPPRAVLFGTRANHFGKFYSVHLADPSLDPAVKDAIERRSGLSFTFEGGRVSWRAYDYGE